MSNHNPNKQSSPPRLPPIGMQAKMSLPTAKSSMAMTKKKEADINIMGEGSSIKTAEEFGFDLGSQSPEINGSDSTKKLGNKKKKVAKKKSLIAPIEPQQIVEHLGIGVDDYEEDDNKWNFPDLQIDAGASR